MKATIIIRLDSFDTFEVGTAEGSTEEVFVANVVAALRLAADEIESGDQ